MGSQNTKLISSNGNEGSQMGMRVGRKGRKEMERLGVKLTENNQGAVKRGIDERQIASGMPMHHQSLQDKFETHRRGTPFKYAVITNAPSNERKGILSKLRGYRPTTTVSTITLSDIPAIRLMGDSIDMPLRSVLSPEVWANGLDYLLLDCILIHFIPLDSFANDKSVVTIQLNDFRKTTNTVARMAKVDNTMGYNILFFLDYCVEKKDAELLTISFSCASKEFQSGIAWGAVKVVAQLQTLSFPKRMPLLDTTGVLLLSDTDLNEFECDPREMDLVITPEALRSMRNANKMGDIENRTLPHTDAREMVTAKTILGEDYESSDVGSLMSGMKAMDDLRKRQQAAQLKNKEKLNQIEEVNEIKHQCDQQSQTGRLNELKEVSVDDSVSNQNASDQDLNDELERMGVPKGVQFVVD